MRAPVRTLALAVACLCVLGLAPATAQPRQLPPQARAGSAAGDLDVWLAPAVAQAGQQVVVHAVYQLTDRPGRGAGQAGAPEGVGGPPTAIGPPEGVGGPPAGVGPFAQAAAEDCPTDADDADETDADDTADDETDDDETDADDTDADDTDADDTAADDGDETDDSADDTAADDGDDETDDGDDVCDDADVVFTVDFGDGSEPVVMTATKTRGRDGSRRALAKHVYAGEGAFPVTVTATPRDGEPATATVDAQIGGGRARLDGETRIETAIRLAQDTFPDDGTAGAVLLARADQFADALAAATMALVEQAPVLLTNSTELPQEVVEEIVRALGDDGTVYLLGGTSAISADVEVALTDLGYTVVRVSGEDRIATSLAIAQFVVDAGLTVDEVVLANAAGFADALAGAALAAADDAVVLLTPADVLDARVAAFIAGLGPVGVTVMGGPSAISAGVVAQLEAMGLSVTRVEGDSRFDTAVTLAEQRFDTTDTVVLTTGFNFPDALAGAALAGRQGAPVLLVAERLPDRVRDFLAARADTIDTILVLGGPGAVPDAIVEAAQSLVAG